MSKNLMMVSHSDTGYRPMGLNVSMEKALLLFSRQIQLHGMQVDRFSMDGIRFIRNVKQTASKENFLLLPLRS